MKTILEWIVYAITRRGEIINKSLGYDAYEVAVSPCDSSNQYGASWLFNAVMRWWQVRDEGIEQYK